VLTASREAFAEGGESTALEEIARRAGAGLGTLYRHFPNGQALLEALYVNEVEEVCRSAAQLYEADPWEALHGWFERLIGYLATKRALAHELLNYLDQDAALFHVCHASLFAAGEPLLERAQQAGIVRADVDFSEVMQMVVGRVKIPTTDPGQTEHIFRIAFGRFRYRPGLDDTAATLPHELRAAPAESRLLEVRDPHASVRARLGPVRSRPWGSSSPMMRRPVSAWTVWRAPRAPMPLDPRAATGPGRGRGGRGGRAVPA
jgi:AcrR family transcriptional regulator